MRPERLSRRAASLTGASAGPSVVPVEGRRRSRLRGIHTSRVDPTVSLHGRSHASGRRRQCRRSGRVQRGSCSRRGARRRRCLGRSTEQATRTRRRSIRLGTALVPTVVARPAPLMAGLETVIAGRYRPDGELVQVARTVPLNPAQSRGLAAVLEPEAADRPWPDEIGNARWAKTGASKVPLTKSSRRSWSRPLTSHCRWRHPLGNGRIRAVLGPDDAPPSAAAATPNEPVEYREAPPGDEPPATIDTSSGRLPAARHAHHRRVRRDRRRPP